MGIRTGAPPPLLFLLGLAFVAGAAVLAWFAAVSTLQLTRADPTTVHAEIVDRLFGVVPMARQPIAGIRAVSMVSGKLPGDTRSRTPDRIVFDTAAGRTDRGYAQQHFVREFATVRDFLQDPARRELAISSIGTSSEFTRFIAAHAAVLFLASVGMLLLWLGVRGLFVPDADIGPV